MRFYVSSEVKEIFSISRSLVTLRRFQFLYSFTENVFDSYSVGGKLNAYKSVEQNCFPIFAVLELNIK